MFLSMSVRYNMDNELTVTYYADEDDFDGNDFYRTLTFPLTETKKLEKLLGVSGAEDMERVIDHRFGHDMYKKFFDEFCRANDVHFRWMLHEDYPGGIHKEGEE